MAAFDETTSFDGSTVLNAEEKSGWVFVFPGQGSQFIGMGKDFYESDEQCRQLIDQAESVSGKKITKLCFNGPISKLSNTDNLQVATTAVNLAIHQYISTHTEIKPEVVLGHSVGEYSALHVAGVLSFADTIKATTERGNLMQREAKTKKGVMLAIKDCSVETLNSIIAAQFEPQQIVIANDNSQKQIVVSASKDDGSKLSAILSDQGIDYVKLPVSGAWHSPLMSGCVEEFSQLIAELSFNQPKIQFVGNLKAQFCEDTQSIQEDLVSHVVEMVRWRESIDFLLNQGYRKFIEVGPKKVLTRLIETINQDRFDLTLRNVESVADVAKL